MTFPLPFSDRLDHATVLFVRLLHGQASVDDYKAADIWRQADPENQRAWDKVASLWAGMDGMADHPEIIRMVAQAKENSARFISKYVEA